MAPPRLKLVLGIQVAVLPVEAHDQAGRHRLLARAVDEAAAEDVRPVGETQGVDDPVRPERVIARELDHRLDPERVDLRVATGPEAIAELRREHPSWAVGQDRDPGADLLGRPVVGLRPAELVEADLGQGDALDGAVLDQQGAGREARVDLHAGPLGAVGQEGDQPRERDRHVAPVVHPRRHHERRDLDGAPAGQEVHLVALDRDDVLHETAIVAPAGQQLVQRGRARRPPRTGRFATRIVEEIQLLIDRYGAKEINIEADSLTINRRLVVAMCEAMIQAGLPARVEWTCKSR